MKVLILSLILSVGVIIGQVLPSVINFRGPTEPAMPRIGQLESVRRADQLERELRELKRQFQLTEDFITRCVGPLFDPYDIC